MTKLVCGQFIHSERIGGHYCDRDANWKPADLIAEVTLNETFCNLHKSLSARDRRSRWAPDRISHGRKFELLTNEDRVALSAMQAEKDKRIANSEREHAKDAERRHDEHTVYAWTENDEPAAWMITEDVSPFHETQWEYRIGRKSEMDKGDRSWETRMLELNAEEDRPYTIRLVTGRNLTPNEASGISRSVATCSESRG